ncbi:RING1 and YY1-binding protein-like protein [Dinothrombium tinctorium]|uniref:RING1 and YY1-binding protein-like protein n=1 Tax=Dinothrombium tinctorium TaxID=1965070 RepID=A0A443QQ46_9ACAR|nr:RING1 and YY1-binding protein-like protein [Dinothrombium tinctorium]RWS05170.1 RING1 and YY1-binding protein-like protein [Dinothrombium tinctorium]
MKDEENTWECSVCTFRNSGEAFKCLMCDVRKGTSTRKPRINPQLVAQQVARQQQQIQQQALKASAKMAEKEAKQMEKVKSPSSSSAISAEKKSKSKDSTAEPLSPSPCLSPGPSNKVAKKKVKDKDKDHDQQHQSHQDHHTATTKSVNSLPKTRLKGVDRKNTSSKAVTVNNVTIIVTEFQPKKSVNHGGDSSEKMSSISASTSDANESISGKAKKKSSK